MTRRAWLEHVLALAPPLGVVLVVNLGVLGSWWIHDDPCLLAAALRSGAAHFFDPEVWRALSGSVLMPWTILSMNVDARIFGLVPAGFYAHQLAAFGVLITVAYAVLRGAAGLSARASSLALVLFAASTPSFAVVHRLMNRHYLEGLIFALTALGLFVVSVRSGRLGPALAGAAAYLLSTTAKEVFVPLVAVLPFVPAGTWRLRLRSAVPFAAAAVLYVPWRLYMLGWSNSLSGYIPQSDTVASPGLVSIAAIVGLVRPWQVAAAGVTVAVALVAVCRRSPELVGLVLVSGAVVGLPLVPVLGELAPRHFLLPAFGVSLMIARALEPWLASRPVPAAALSLALVLATLHALGESPIRSGYGATVERHRTEGAFVLEAEGGGVLLTRLADPNYLRCIAELRVEVLGAARGPRFCGDACWCAGAFVGEDFRVAEDGEVVVAGEPPGPGCAEQRELEVEMSYDRARGRLAWRFGPYGGERGGYRILLLSGGEPADVSAPAPVASTGDVPFAVVRPLRLVVTYWSAQGWRTYSPVLTLDPAVGSLRWERGRGSDP